MSKPFPLDLFPEQLFPDVQLERVQLLGKELLITASDSTWGLQPDITFFYGPGVMSFTYTGGARLRCRHPREKEGQYLVTPEILEQLGSLEMISRGDSVWIFRFRPREGLDVVEILLTDVTKITWSGEGADLEEED